MANETDTSSMRRFPFRSTAIAVAAVGALVVSIVVAARVSSMESRDRSNAHTAESLAREGSPGDLELRPFFTLPHLELNPSLVPGEAWRDVVAKGIERPLDGDPRENSRGGSHPGAPDHAASARTNRNTTPVPAAPHSDAASPPNRLYFIE